MKCPYITTTIHTEQPCECKTERIIYDDEDGTSRVALAYMFTTKHIVTESMSDCAQQQCGAWNNNKCGRNR